MAVPIPDGAIGPQTRGFQLGNRLAPLVYLSSNWISRLGVFLVTTAGVSWLFALPANLNGSHHPYAGLLTIIVIPAVFFLGLALIPLGIRLLGRRPDNAEFPPLRWNNPQFRQMVLFIGFATAANTLMGGHFTYTAIEYMDSVEFCGATCHIMAPEHAAYKVAPHAQVRCVDCHIGEGAGSYVEAKLNGAKQLLQVVMNIYHVPVPTPVHNLAQGNLTCSGCHANRDFGNKRWQAVRFASDLNNSATLTQLAISIGGGNSTAGAHGAHLSNLASIEYSSTPDRKRIEWIRYRDPNGRETIFARANAKPTDVLRKMDCTDCHNRAAHSFEDPSAAVDRSLAAGRIDHTLPEIKKAALQQLNQNDNITESLRAFYQSRHPGMASAREPVIAKAATELEAIRSRNVFPEWGVGWGTHPNFMGHNGCFRCHNSDLVSQDDQKRSISQSCTGCHRIEKMDEPVEEPVLTSTSSVDTGMPTRIPFVTNAGEVAFDHAKHLQRAKGECTTCHDKYFPMERADLRYKANLHRTAEASRTSCAACHVSGGDAFASAGSCERCHTSLSEPIRTTTTTPGADASSPLPGEMRFDTAMGTAAFSHSQHVTLAKGDCTSCHNKLFPMSKSDLNYRQGLHRVAESAKSSCAGCHAPSGTAFASTGNCQRCHGDLGTPRATPRTGISGLPDSRSIETRLGSAKFDHAHHVTISKGECRSCHNKIFPLAKGMLNYADNLHATAEQNRSSCGACHRESGTAFASKNNCLNCHTELNARADLPALAEPIQYATRLGDVNFNHNRHIRAAQGDCTQCHSKVFPMERRGLTGYSADHHRTAEANGGLCAACHASGKPAFATLNNCRKCHLGLERQSAN